MFCCKCQRTRYEPEPLVEGDVSKLIRTQHRFCFIAGITPGLPDPIPY